MRRLLVFALFLLASCRSPESGIELKVLAGDVLGVDALVITLSAEGTDPVEVRAPDPAARLGAEESVGIVVKRPALVGVEVSVTLRGYDGDLEVARGDTQVRTRDGDVVRASVTLAAAYACGDGVVHAREACDDGGTEPGDGCAADCVVEAGYVCSGAPSACVRCGDGVVDSTEGCDDGNENDDDGCSSSCEIEDGFACDGAPSVCASVCGDGKVVAAEACDDGANTPGDGCTEDCVVERGFVCSGAPSACVAPCGDGIIAGAEACDDGRGDDGDGCDASCALEDGWSCAGEPTACLSVCGDGIVVGLEECDDGLANSDTLPDACRTSCLLPRCGDAVADTNEGCDDGNLDNTDTCLTSCALAGCGDGFLQGTESCDDGNLVDGDGCSGCTVDVTHRCGGQPSVCATLVSSAVVDAGGGGSFTTISAGVAAAADGDTLFIRPGTYNEAVYVNGTDLTLVGDGAVVVQTGGNSATLRARAAVATVHGLTLRHTGTAQPVVRAETPQGGASITLVGSTVGPSGDIGVVAASNSTIALERTLVSGNLKGGLDLDGNYSVVNSALIDNGGPGAAIGGASFAVSGVFRFSTVAGNESTGAALICTVATPIEASIVYGNTGSGPFSGLCDGSASSTADPLFDADGYHLAEQSPARNAGPVTGCPATDIDGDARPIGDACALGADERP